MAENIIGLKSIGELLEMKFFIPSYQRGYRWTKQQVKDLLNDVDEFCPQKVKDNNEETWYCLQPLVIRKMEVSNPRLTDESNKEGWYEVIDGQQRLTTIFLIVHYFNEMWVGKQKKSLPTIHYETRSDSFDFLNAIEINEDNVVAYSQNGKPFGDYIDYHYMKQAYNEIHRWAKGKDSMFDNNSFQSKLIAKTRFIWYESVDEDPVKVFTRLNIGKISLTNAELIKALLLNRSNFGEQNDDHLKLRQQEIASEWDNIEYTLQNDEFWLFLRNIEENDEGNRSTRIDFIFDLLCEQQSLGKFDNIGNDDHRTFRYFYEYFHKNNTNSCTDKIKDCWAEVKKYHQTFQEWFNDLEFYHYVGYLIHQGEKLEDLYKLWHNENSKENFVSKLKDRIKGKINNCNDLTKQYEIDGGPAKNTCKPLLLLHNIQTIINQNNQLKSKEEYKLPVFYKFPFHLFKKEKWDVEHIDSNTANELEKIKDQKEWLKYSIIGADLKDELKEKIKSFIYDKDANVSFDELATEIESLTPSKWANPEQDKNKIWNFVLLDAGTNRGYGNSIFPAKRRCIIGKDQGKTYVITDDLNVTMKDGAIAFIPPVTRNVFLKYYNTSVDDLRVWNENDATAYKQNILDTLKEFEVLDSSNNQNTKNDGQ